MNETIVIALIAAGSALLGSLVGLAGQYIAARQSSKHEREVYFRQKYEEFVLLTSDLETHFFRLGDDAIEPSERKICNEAIVGCTQRMEVLGLIYFQKLSSEVSALIDAALELQLDQDQDQGSSCNDHETKLEDFGKAIKEMKGAISAFSSDYVGAPPQ